MALSLSVKDDKSSTRAYSLNTVDRTSLTEVFSILTRTHRGSGDTGALAAARSAAVLAYPRLKRARVNSADNRALCFKIEDFSGPVDVAIPDFVSRWSWSSSSAIGCVS